MFVGKSRNYLMILMAAILCWSHFIISPSEPKAMFVGDIRHQLQMGMGLVQLLFILLIGDLPRFSAIPKIVERHLHTQKLTQNHKQVGL